MNDVEPRLFTSVIREMIRHENDVTNHRIMWLLIGQGLIANAFVSSGSDRRGVVLTLAPVGILVTLSAFVILYKSYQARGYLHFLGQLAKAGTLREENLPLSGWPPTRIKGWRRGMWPCPWLGKTSDLLEPYMFLPALLIVAWLFLLIHRWLSLDTVVILGLTLVGVVLLLFLVCVIWVWWETGDEQRSLDLEATQSANPVSP